MKKIFLGMVAFALIFTSCSNDQNEALNEQSKIDMSDFYLYTDDNTNSSLDGRGVNDNHTCASMQVLNRQLQENPGLYQKMYDIEYFTRTLIAAKGKPSGTPGGGNGGSDGGNDPTPYVGTVTIDVVINILEDKLDDVTQAQIDSQIDILNEDYNDNNPNTSDSDFPNEFSDLVANSNITFKLSTVIRKISTKSTWGTNDAMKDFSQGGIDATDTSTYLNIWVCNIGGGILGYAQFPGGSADTDGIVIGNDYFGETSGVYGDGRTATHEVGHWLNLRHIWGDGRCKKDDFVADTPSSDRPNYGCPKTAYHCRSNDMHMNYMDYVYDDCMYMFTKGQDDRMRALFVSGGARASLAEN